MVKHNNRAFKGVWIDKEIWLDKNLTWMEKLFIVEINSLDNDSGCYASNKYFSEFFDLSKSRCSQIINSLKNKNYIEIKLQRKGKQIIKRTIHTIIGGGKKTKGGWLENAVVINICSNNTKDKRYIHSSYYQKYIEKLKKGEMNLPEVIFNIFIKMYNETFPDKHSYYKQKLVDMCIQEIEFKIRHFEIYEIETWISMIETFFNEFHKTTDCSLRLFTSGKIIENLYNRMV